MKINNATSLEPKSKISMNLNYDTISDKMKFNLSKPEKDPKFHDITMNVSSLLY